MRGCDLLQVVDIVDEAAFDFIHARIHIPRHCDVDEKHGAMAAALEEGASMCAVEDVMVGAGGGDDDVGTAGLRVELVEGDDLDEPLADAVHRNGQIAVKALFGPEHGIRGAAGAVKFNAEHAEISQRTQRDRDPLRTLRLLRVLCVRFGGASGAPHLADTAPGDRIGPAYRA